MKYFLFLLMLVSVAACNSSSNNEVAGADSTTNKEPIDSSSATYIHNFADTALERKITAELLKLPFVTRSNNYIDSFSNHKHGITFMLNDPEGNETDIHVQAGYNGAERFETYYRFFVNPKTLEIKVYDPVENKKLTVKEYLKAQR